MLFRSPQQLEFTAEDIDEMDAEEGVFSFWDEKKRARLILTKETFVMASTSNLLKNLKKAQSKTTATATIGDGKAQAKDKIKGEQAAEDEEKDGN